MRTSAALGSYFPTSTSQMNSLRVPSTHVQRAWSTFSITSKFWATSAGVIAGCAKPWLPSLPGPDDGEAPPHPARMAARMPTATSSRVTAGQPTLRRLKGGLRERTGFRSHRPRRRAASAATGSGPLVSAVAEPHLASGPFLVCRQRVRPRLDARRRQPRFDRRHLGRSRSGAAGSGALLHSETSSPSASTSASDSAPLRAASRGTKSPST